MYEVRPLVREDLFVLRQHTQDASWSFVTPQLEYALCQGFSYVGTYDGRLLAAGGVITCWPGVGEAWFAVTPEGHFHRAFIFRRAMAYLNLMRPNFRRLQCTVSDDFTEGRRFVEHLGFNCDTPNGLKKYGVNGETFHIYSRT